MTAVSFEFSSLVNERTKILFVLIEVNTDVCSDKLFFVIGILESESMKH